MKLLLFSDVHENKTLCRQLVEMAREAEIVIGAGDFGSFRKGIKETIDVLKDIENPTLLVPGNAESFEELQEACKSWSNARVLHGNGVTLKDEEFYGIGGGIPVTPFGLWSYDFTEEQARDLLKECPENAVLISHSPPKGILDISSGGDSLGSTSVRNVITQKSPKLVVCGHIHESSGKIEKVDGTDVINAGPGGMLYELN